MNKRVGMVCLGCAKNRVDGEMMLYNLREAGYELVADVANSEVAIVNTCGFIEDAKQESIDEILELAELKKEGKIKFPDKEELALCGGRVRTTPFYYAYLKIAEGCDNKCTYCAIPMIRGKFRSRPMEDILQEAKELSEKGVKELILIAQDTSYYGEDIYGKPYLSELLKELCKIDSVKYLRVLYCYPERMTDELIDTFANEEKVLKYIDIPLQHCNGNVLKKMNRHGNRETLTALVNKLRERVPDITIRTTFMTGFPGETEEEFAELSEFVNEMKFERMGCFAYSMEEDTPAAKKKMHKK